MRRKPATGQRAGVFKMNEAQDIMRSETEPINVALKSHQASAKDWRYRGLLAEIHTWAERFTVGFKLNIPFPAIVVDRLRGRCLGHFRSGRNAWGLKDEVAIDRVHATSDDFWQALGTLLHELIHLWQQKHGDPPSNNNFNYHNREYRDKALELGLVVDRWGHTRYAPENSPFLALLTEYGVEVPVLPPPEQQHITIGRLNSSKLKLWQCRCPVRVRVARADFRARCLVCGQIFERKD